DLINSVFVFPQETKDSYVLVKATPEQPLQNFTVCLRSYTDLTRPYSLFSYATKAQDNDILLSKPKPSEYRLYVGGKSVSFRVPKGSSMGSEHICASWESTTGIVGFWFNGVPWPRKGLQKGYAVSHKAVILLGQKQGSFEGGFDKRSFTGEISDVYMWDLGISTREVASIMYNSPEEAPIFGWRNLPYKIEGEVYLKP
ncbi:SAMP protein, partial [Casuarius casuarius]|nr:SAMP protein [Casuarius casuarius]